MSDEIGSTLAQMTNAGAATGDLLYYIDVSATTAGSKVIPLGQLDLRWDANGAAAAAQAVSCQKSANLSDVATPATARANLGCGTASTHATGDFVLSTAVGAVSGVCPLDSGSKVPTANLPASVLGAVEYQGAWNASTNSPTIPAASAGNKGQYYVVSVAGTTAISGFSNWKAGDWLVSDGTNWDPIPGAQALATVALTGAYSDLSGLPSLGTAASHAATDFDAAGAAAAAQTAAEGASVLKSVVTTSGDLIVGTGSAAVSRLAIGSNGKVLGVSGGALAWVTAGGAGWAGMGFVASGGNDSTAAIGNPSLPYATAQAALTAGAVTLVLLNGVAGGDLSLAGNLVLDVYSFGGSVGNVECNGHNITIKCLTGRQSFSITGNIDGGGSGVSVTLYSLTVTNNVLNDGGTNTIDDCTIEGGLYADGSTGANGAAGSGGQGGAGVSGGNAGTIIATNCSLYGVSANGGPGGVGGADDGTNGAGPGGNGGNGGSIQLVNCTVAEQLAAAGGAGGNAGTDEGSGLAANGGNGGTGGELQLVQVSGGLNGSSTVDGGIGGSATNAGTGGNGGTAGSISGTYVVNLATDFSCQQGVAGPAPSGTPGSVGANGNVAFYHSQLFGPTTGNAATYRFVIEANVSIDTQN